MADTALENAEHRLRHTKEMIATHRRQIQAAQEALARVEAEAERLKLFIVTWYEMTGHSPPDDIGQMENTPIQESKPKRPKNPPREEVAAKAVEIIRQHGSPMLRRELFDALAAKGVKIQGKDPEMVLSTMLWRESGLIVRLPPHGYWPKDTAYLAAHYDPEIDDLIGSAAHDPEGEIEEDEDTLL